MNNNNSKVHGWGIVGTARHADGFFAPALKQANNTNLVAICSRDKDRGSAFKMKHGAKKNYTDYCEMLADPEIDVVYIASPNNLHAPQTIQAAEAGKHILCEKPMALTEEECTSMIQACQKAGVKLGLDFQNRHHPAHVEASRLIRSGVVGDITLATAQYSHGFFDTTNPSVVSANWRQDPGISGGGAIMGTGVHCLDLLRYLVGKDIEEVTAMTDQKWSCGPVDQENYIIMKFKDGPFASVFASRHVRQAYNDVVIYGTKARITGVNTVGMPLKGELQVDSDSFTTKTCYPTEKIDSRGHLTTVLDRVTGNYVRVIEAFNECIDKNTEPNGSGEDGLAMVRLVKAIFESANHGKAVRLME